jgi:hypothetical protein
MNDGASFDQSARYPAHHLLKKSNIFQSSSPFRHPPPMDKSFWSNINDSFFEFQTFGRYFLSILITSILVLPLSHLRCPPPRTQRAERATQRRGRFAARATRRRRARNRSGANGADQICFVYIFLGGGSFVFASVSRQYPPVLVSPHVTTVAVRCVCICVVFSSLCGNSIAFFIRLRNSHCRCLSKITENHSQNFTNTSLKLFLSASPHSSLNAPPPPLNQPHNARRFESRKNQRLRSKTRCVCVRPHFTPVIRCLLRVLRFVCRSPRSPSLAFIIANSRPRLSVFHSLIFAPAFSSTLFFSHSSALTRTYTGV